MTRRLPWVMLLVGVWTAGASPRIRAAIKPHGLISEGMVLQQSMGVPIWGTAENEDSVTVRFQDQKVTGPVKDGKWRVALKNLKAGGPFELTISGKETIQIKDVYVGEVWVCSGQSNMEQPLHSTLNADKAIAASKNVNVRLFTVPHRTDYDPQTDVKGHWLECGPDTVKNFSAVAYYFGRDINKALGVPVGLIHSSWGGTTAEAWTSLPALEKHVNFKDVQARVAQGRTQYEKGAREISARRARHNLAVAQAKKDGTKAPAALVEPANPALDPNRPGALYNGMIAPLVPFAIRGVIWYQGESNAGRAFQYRTLFPLMIKNWRQTWGSEFPFLLVQLAPWQKRSQEPNESAWAELREAQLQTTQTVPHTAMAVITDVGDEKDIHPRQKEPVGARLALAARALAYGDTVEYAGPVYDKMKVVENKIALTFQHVGGGLVAKDGPLLGFAIAGEDHIFVNATAEIQGAAIVVSSPKVAKPVAVRYGWANFPIGNLWNQAGLPASPFRTDDFPGITTQQRPRARLRVL